MKKKQVKTRESFLDTFKKIAGPEFLRKDVIRALSVLNAQALCFEATDEETQNKIAHDALDFMNYFYDQFGDDAKLFRAIKNNWPDQPPLIFRLADYMSEFIMRQRYEEAYETFDDQTKSNLELLYSYVLNCKEDRQATITTSPEAGAVVISIGKGMSKKDFDKTVSALHAALAMFFAEPGGMILRRRDEKGGFIVNGFSSDGEGHVHPLGIGELRDCCCTQPDGSYVEAEDEVYEKPALIFAKA